MLRPARIRNAIIIAGLAVAAIGASIWITWIRTPVFTLTVTEFTVTKEDFTLAYRCDLYGPWKVEELYVTEGQEQSSGTGPSYNTGKKHWLFLREDSYDNWSRLPLDEDDEVRKLQPTNQSITVRNHSDVNLARLLDGSGSEGTFLVRISPL